MSASLEEEIWTEAAVEVLEDGSSPMHYLDIKRVILQRSLVGPGLKTTLESALYREIKREGTRLKMVEGQSGVFTLKGSEPLTVVKEIIPTPVQSVAPQQTVQQVVQQTVQQPTEKVVNIQQLTPQQIKQIMLLQQQKLQQQQQLQSKLAQQSQLQSQQSQLQSQQPQLQQQQSPQPQSQPKVPKVVTTTKVKNVANLQFQRMQLHKALSKQGQKTKMKVKHNVGQAKPISALSQMKYKSKYSELKKFAKHMIFKNAALCDEVCEMEKKIAKCRDERRFLLSQLLKHQPVLDIVTQSVSSQIMAQQAPPSPVANIPPVSSDSPSLSSSFEEKPVLKPKKKVIKKKRDGMDDIPKPKVKKSGKSNKRLVQPIPLDSTGRPIFPIELGDLTVHSLGEVVCERPAFHTVEHIFPVGFCSTQLYASIENPAEQCLYTCKIIDEGQMPKFEIAPDDHPGLVFAGSTADVCHTKLLNAINYQTGMQVVPTDPHGSEFFGFSHPTIQNLIQSSHGARKCSSYKWAKFEVCKSEAEVPSFADDVPTVTVTALYQTARFRKYLEARTSQKGPGEGSASLRSLLTSAGAERY